jgi:hypothetical protein
LITVVRLVEVYATAAPELLPLPRECILVAPNKVRTFWSAYD